MGEQIKITWKNISTNLKIIIILACGFSIVSIGINVLSVNLILFSVEKVGYFRTTTTEIKQFQSPDLIYELSITNAEKETLHNTVLEDGYGNEFFVKDYMYNVSIPYAKCNEAGTNCVVYSNFLIENHEVDSICFKQTNRIQIGPDSGRVTFEKTDYAQRNPDKCISKVK